MGLERLDASRARRRRFTGSAGERERPPLPSPPDNWRNRRETLLAGIDVAAALGLEFGPLTAPLVGRQEGRVEYVDHATTAELRIKYADDRNVDVTRLIEVDHVLEEGRLPATVRGRAFDYIVAAHVFEHLPNPLGWLRECAEVLGANGVVGLTIPDKRFTFDRVRPQTTLADWIEADLLDRRLPSPRSVFEGALLTVPMPPGETWHRPPTAAELAGQGWGSLDWVLETARKATQDYFDIHCTIATPRSCLELLADTAELGLHPFRLAMFHDTAFGAYEFNVQLGLGADRGPRERAAGFREAASSTHQGSPYDDA